MKSIPSSKEIYSLGFRRTNSFFVIKNKIKSGEMVWQKSVISLPQGTTLVISAIKNDSLFNFYLAGSISTTSGKSNAFLAKIDSSGNLIYSKSIAVS
ncbi:MAG: hypothetical protein K2Q22_12815, partial [Cytophagales bacterium]|nr:hypothetical protein [Cytophagales bacterium]